MADRSAPKLVPDGTVILYVGGERHTLRQVTLGELRAFRKLQHALSAEVEDEADFRFRPELTDLREKAKAASTAAARAKVRKKLDEAREAQDLFVQSRWAKWWREVIGTLSSDALPDANADDPADGLEPWMVDSPQAIGSLVAHWRADPLAASGDPVTEALLRLAQNG